jgi:hypothetical protein
MIETQPHPVACGQTGPDVRDARRTSTHRTTRDETSKGLTAVSAGQTLVDLARPKGLEPLTF